MTWETELLFALAAPTTNTSRSALALWAQSEGMPTSANNWLACGTPWPGTTAWNSAGVKIYPNEAAGIGATAGALLRDDYGYPAIVSALRSNAGLGAIWRAINASGWCSGCQTGLYPIALYKALPNGGAPTTPGRPSTPPPTPGATAGKVAYTGTWSQIHSIANEGAASLHARLVNAAIAASEVQ